LSDGKHEKKRLLCLCLLLSGSLNQCVDERSLLLAGAVQIRRWLLLASVCAVDVRVSSLRSASGIVGLCTAMQFFCRALIAQHLLNAP